jgi:hypothetical protein
MTHNEECLFCETLTQYLKDRSYQASIAMTTYGKKYPYIKIENEKLDPKPLVIAILKHPYFIMHATYYNNRYSYSASRYEYTSELCNPHLIEEFYIWLQSHRI